MKFTLLISAAVAASASALLPIGPEFNRSGAAPAELASRDASWAPPYSGPPEITCSMTPGPTYIRNFTIRGRGFSYKDVEHELLGCGPLLKWYIGIYNNDANDWTANGTVIGWPLDIAVPPQICYSHALHTAGGPPDCACADPAAGTPVPDGGCLSGPLWPDDEDDDDDDK